MSPVSSTTVKVSSVYSSALSSARSSKVTALGSNIEMYALKFHDHSSQSEGWPEKWSGRGSLIFPAKSPSPPRAILPKSTGAKLRYHAKLQLAKSHNKHSKVKCNSSQTLTQSLNLSPKCLGLFVCKVFGLSQQSGRG